MRACLYLPRRAAVNPQQQGARRRGPSNTPTPRSCSCRGTNLVGRRLADDHRAANVKPSGVLGCIRKRETWRCRSGMIVAHIIRLLVLVVCTPSNGSLPVVAEEMPANLPTTTTPPPPPLQLAWGATAISTTTGAVTTTATQGETLPCCRRLPSSRRRPQPSWNRTAKTTAATTTTSSSFLLLRPRFRRQCQHRHHRRKQRRMAWK